MTQIITAKVDRPIVDYRHFSSLLNAHDAVRHHWTLARINRYANPTPNGLSGPDRIRPRKGLVPLESTYTAAAWTALRGTATVAQFPDDPSTSVDNSNGKFIATIPTPGPIFSVLLWSQQPTADTQGAVGIHFADAGTMEIQPARGAFRTVRVNNSAPRDLGPAVPLNAWVFSEWVFDLVNGELAASVNGEPFVSTPLAIPGFVPPAAATALVRVGYSVTSKPFSNGAISDVSVVSGDVRTMPGLQEGGHYYNQTGYGV